MGQDTKMQVPDMRDCSAMRKSKGWYRQRWGGWYVDRTRLEIRYPLRDHDYPIGLDIAAMSSAHCLDWIMQVKKKTWATPQVLAGLVTALDDILNSQGNLCTCGTECGPGRIEIPKNAPTSKRRD
jgi:hypothetical protein